VSPSIDRGTTDMPTGIGVSPLAGAERRDAGDSAFVLEFGTTIERSLLDRVSALDAHVRRLAADGALPGLIETVPTFRSLALLFDPLLTTPARLLTTLAEPARNEGSTEPGDGPATWVLPVLYGGDHGPDLDALATEAALPDDELVRRHLDTPLVVYMLGFLPGFAFLGDIDPALQRPRRPTPRVRVPAGSVAVANTLSAIYPWESPGGWHLIGHCPVPLFDACRATPALLQPADAVRFRSIDADEHAHLVNEMAADRLDPDTLRA